jgi:hypothetical protein
MVMMAGLLFMTVLVMVPFMFATARRGAAEHGHRPGRGHGQGPPAPVATG